MHYVVTLKVYKEIGGEVDKHWYRVKNAKEVIDLEICSGDTINIDGIGKLEVFGVHYQSNIEGRNPYKSLTVTCGLVGNLVAYGGNEVPV